MRPLLLLCIAHSAAMRAAVARDSYVCARSGHQSLLRLHDSNMPVDEGAISAHEFARSANAPPLRAAPETPEKEDLAEDDGIAWLRQSVLRDKSTEPSGYFDKPGGLDYELEAKYKTKYPQEGAYHCEGCGSAVYWARQKIGCGCGWPARASASSAKPRPRRASRKAPQVLRRRRGRGRRGAGPDGDLRPGRPLRRRAHGDRLQALRRPPGPHLPRRALRHAHGREALRQRRGAALRAWDAGAARRRAQHAP